MMVFVGTLNFIKGTHSNHLHNIKTTPDIIHMRIYIYKHISTFHPHIFISLCLLQFSFILKGKVRLQRLERPTVIKISAPLTTVTPKHKTEKTPSPLMPSMTTGE